MTRQVVPVAILVFGLAIATAGCFESRDNRASAPASSLAAPPVPPITILSAQDMAKPQRLEARKRHRYELHLAADEYLHVVVDQQGTDVYTGVLDPTGELLFMVDSHAPAEEAENLHFISAEDGVHTLEIAGFGTAAGNYRLEIRHRRPPTAEDRLRARAELSFALAYALAEDRLPRTVPPEVVDGFQDAASLFAELGATERQSLAFYELAEVYLNAEQESEALAYFERCTKLASSLRYRALASNKMGLIQQRGGDPLEARRSLNIALHLFRELGDLRNEMATLQVLSRLDARQGRALDALEKLHYAEGLALQVGDRLVLRDVYNSLGEIYKNLGKSRLALDHHRQALALADPRNEPLHRATTLRFLGNALAAAGELDDASEAYAECLRLRQQGKASQSDRSRVLADLGVVEIKRGNLRRALEYLQRALTAFEGHSHSRRDQAATLNNIAWIHNELRRAEQARELHSEALALYEALDDQEGRALSRQGLSFAYSRQGLDVEALREAAAALSEIEKLLEEGQAPASRPDLQLPYVASRQHYFDHYIDLLMQQHQRQPAGGFDSLALAVSEQARSRHLLEILSGDPSLNRAPADNALAQQQRSLRGEINAADLEIRRLENTTERAQAERLQRRRWAEYHRLTQRIRESDANYVATPPRALALPEIQQSLDDDTLLLEYHVGQQHAFVWVVAKEWMESRQLASPLELERVARRARQELLRSDQIHHRIAADRALDELSKLLLQPIATLLEGRRLLVVSNGALEYIPFAVLPLPATPQKRVVETYEIVRLPSASVLATLRSRPRSRPSELLAIFADAVFHAGDPRLTDAVVAETHHDPELSGLRRIPHSGHEAAAIVALTSGRGKVLDVRGFEATRELITSGQLAPYRFLHFATHGALREDVPELSALVLSRYRADGTAINGRLRLHEIYDFELSADLVVLSACQSALGPQIRGEGLMGLPRGFLYAGARSVLASLWKVQDESTAELMTRFYRLVLIDELAPAAALRAAQRSMQAERRYSPYHWAGFVLLGDGWS